MRWTEIFPATLRVKGRKYFKTPGQFNHTVPAGSFYMRATALGCGGQGENWGGGGALARSIVPVTPGENIKVQVGNTSTASTPGDSWVRRNDNTTICYADRGRGNGTRGLAINSVGDVRRDGQPGSGSLGGGPPATDAGDYGEVGFGGRGQGAPGQNNLAANHGGGGAIAPVSNEYAVFIGYAIFAAGCGFVCLEFFNEKPGS